jgi:hypothetical protein
VQQAADGAGPLCAIPQQHYYAIGQLVKLTVNISPQHMSLFNGSRGTIRDIVYKSGGYQPNNVPAGLVSAVERLPEWPVIMVEFPGYSGPSLFTAEEIADMKTNQARWGDTTVINFSKLVPIYAVERR